MIGCGTRLQTEIEQALPHIGGMTQQDLGIEVEKQGHAVAQRFRIEGIRASVLSEYAKALYGDPEKAKSLLSVAKPLAIFVNQLDFYAKHTKAISPR